MKTQQQHQALLQTKFFLPSLAKNIVSRPRLLQRLDDGLNSQVILISAPAGFGKTTLLSDWIRAKPLPAAWLSLDPSENELVGFLRYLTAAVQTLYPDTARATSQLLEAPQTLASLAAESILVSFINDLSFIETPFLLVLDDYHLIENQRIHQAVEFLVEHSPPHLTLVLSTRSDPALSLARWRVQQILTEIRAMDLCFNLQETSEFLNDRLALQLSRSDLKLISHRTEGWAAGLQLAFLSLKGRSDISSFIRAFRADNRYVVDYLMEEVWQCQPPALQSFLLKTSILDQLEAGLCDAVTGEKNSHQMLQLIEKSNLFLFPLDDQRQWFRYHGLFADLLRQRVDNTQDTSELHHRASLWYHQNGYIHQAVDHALQAADHELATQWIQEIAEHDWDRGQQSQLLKWIKQLDPSLIENNPQMCIYFARELWENNEIDASESYLHQAEQLLDHSEITQKDDFLGRIAVMRGIMASYRGNSEKIIHHIHQAMQLLPAENLIWQSVAATTLGFAYGWSGIGNMPKAAEAFEQASKLCDKAKNTYFYLFAEGCLCTVMAYMGKLDASMQRLQAGVQYAKEHHMERTAPVASIFGTMGAIYCQWNEIEKGVDYINKGLEISLACMDPLVTTSLQMALVKSHLYLREYDKAQALRDVIIECEEKFLVPPWIKANLDALQVMIWLLQKKMHLVEKWSLQRQLSIDDSLNQRTELRYLTFSLVLLAKNREDEALVLIERLVDQARSNERIFILIELLLIKVDILLKKHKKDQAIEILESALQYGQSGPFIFPFLAYADRIAPLLAELRALDKCNGFVDGLFACEPLSSLSNEPHSTEPLSQRESEVLALLSVGFSNKEIGDKLFISLNTVKTHIKNINSKLDVSNRVQAIQRAKEMHLLD
jgi:LuxR family maltose regulon positive regulatory protein